ncbi:MAG: hypothetical protein VX970_10050 [Planctomycetota bacterium]|nr:hypothetical protein [Planctomycetota bacterium]
MNNHSGDEPIDNPENTRQLSSLTRVFYLIGILLGAGALATWLSAPPPMVTSILLKEKPAVTSSLTGLQLGERLAEGGSSDLYLILEYADGDRTETHRTEVIEVATLGNGVLFDIPDNVVELAALQRITVYDEDFFSDDIYDSIDVNLSAPYIGSVYQFEIQHTGPYRNMALVLSISAVAALTLAIVFSLRQRAR